MAASEIALGRTSPVPCMTALRAKDEPPPAPRFRSKPEGPFGLRVDLGRNVPETDVRSALAGGDMGFLHRFTTGSAVDDPGVRVVAWTRGRNFSRTSTPVACREG